MQHTVSIICRMSCICVERHTFMNFRECMQPLMISWGLFIRPLIVEIGDQRCELSVLSISFLPRFMPFIKLVPSLFPNEFASKVVSTAIVPRKLAWSKYEIMHIMFTKMSSATVAGFICEDDGCLRVMLQFLTQWMEIILNPTEKNSYLTKGKWLTPSSW